MDVLADKEVEFTGHDVHELELVSWYFPERQGTQVTGSIQTEKLDDVAT